jgi:hypothetical protein
MEFLLRKKFEERVFVKKNLGKTVDLTIEGLAALMSMAYEKSQFRKCLKMGLLFIAKVDRSKDKALREAMITKVVGWLRNKESMEELANDGESLFRGLDGVLKLLAQKEFSQAVGIVSKWFLEPFLAHENEFFKGSVLDCLAHYITTDSESAVASIKQLHSRTKMSSCITSLVHSILLIKGGQEPGAKPEQLLAWAKKALLAYPCSLNLRALYNDVLLYTGIYSGLNIGGDDEEERVLPEMFCSDFRLLDIFRSNTKGLKTLNQRMSALKVGCLTYPQKPFFQNALRFLKKLKLTPEVRQREPLDSDEVFEQCKYTKSTILEKSFGVTVKGIEIRLTIRRPIFRISVYSLVPCRVFQRGKQPADQKGCSHRQLDPAAPHKQAS